MEKYYTTREVMEILHRSRSAVFAYVRSGQLRAYQTNPNARNSKYLFAESDLEDFIKRGVVPGYWQRMYPRPHKGEQKADSK